MTKSAILPNVTTREPSTARLPQIFLNYTQRNAAIMLVLSLLLFCLLFFSFFICTYSTLIIPTSVPLKKDKTVNFKLPSRVISKYSFVLIFVQFLCSFFQTIRPNIFLSSKVLNTYCLMMMLVLIVMLKVN